MPVVDEIEAERPPASEGSPIHPICDSCAGFHQRHIIGFDAEYRGDTCCFVEDGNCDPRGSRGKFIEMPHEAVHKVWIH